MTTTQFTHLNTVMNAHRETAERRAMLDKAIIGMAAMVNLIERIKGEPMASYDPEAAAVEALDMIKITEAAASQERTRIVAALRQRASEWEIENGNMTVASALSSFAMRLEEGTI